ncbi:MAG TPA: aminotransferase class III-fold pyridoxal phosphate-dependent enzyme, partial [Psychrobacter sp.]|uniref:aminotransferase class III-fold pyridoxal phosphate-dependent enzyme n=1 Tax=Psychrobacter sp. TaxID=56811 RepID=UPI002B97F3BE
MTTASTNEFDQQHLWHPYASLPPSYPNMVIDHAEGIYIVTEDGTRLIDGMSSWWASVHGYNHPKLNAAVIKQLGKMAHVMFGGLTHQPAIDLGRKLLSIVPTGLDAIFYADSGSIAVEVALKMALQYQIAAKCPTKQQFASTHSGYYGDT